ncbi:MAG TPA: recombinase family protein, partial [Symbiobacteriaceae bacterium]|nr:recombinase family protein [Symbiobacteriaceae bacterium]
MKEIRPDHVAIYIRWSTEDQGEGTTLDVQMDGCKACLGIQGWQFTSDLVFIDDGYSGGSLDRPALTRLRRLVSRGGIDCVVVYKLD